MHSGYFISCFAPFACLLFSGRLQKSELDVKDELFVFINLPLLNLLNLLIIIDFILTTGHFGIMTTDQLTCQKFMK